MRTVFDVGKKRGEIAKIEQEMESPDFWEDKDRASMRSQELSALKREVVRLDGLTNEINGLIELLFLGADDSVLLKEIESKVWPLIKEVKDIEIELFFSGKYDKGNAVVSVYAGAGGKDAEDWAALLARMYQRFAEKKGWKIKIIHEHWGENRGPAGWGLKMPPYSLKRLTHMDI